MKVFRFTLSLVFSLICSFGFNEAGAQVVSLLINADEKKDSLAMEIAMKKLLKEEGYEIKKITSREGFFLYIQFMPIGTIGEQMTLGYAGNVFIGSQAWTEVVDSFMPASCDMAPYQKMKNDVGMEMILLDSQLFTDSSIESLAESMTTRAKAVIREKSAEMTELIKQETEK